MRSFFPFVFLLIVLAVPAALEAQSTRLSMNLINVSVNDVLNEIEENSKYTFLVNEEFVDVSRKVDAVFVNTSIKEILEKIFEGENVKFVTINRQIVLSSKTSKPREAFFQPVTITGKVTDALSGEGLSGLSVQVKGTKSGTITNNEGNYSILLQSAEAILVFSHIGYEPQEFSTKGLSVINVSMKEAVTELETVIVTAFGIRRTEKALGYSVQKLEGESIQTIKIVDPTTSLTGKISGLLVKNSTNFGTAPILNLRGEIPLLVVDGVPSVNVSINDISPDDIRSIDVLKGATASAIYGYRGANGAIIISTLRGRKDNGLSVSVNSSNMLNLGFVASPETQTAYSSGYNGKYGNDYVWGDRLDIGRTATLWDPAEMQWKENTPLVSKGSNNLKNFQELGFISNNNISITSQNDHSSLRTSISHVYNKGQFPNQKMNKITYSLGGLIEIDKLTLESNFTYTKNISPNINGSQYSGGYLYNLIGWVGAEWDVRDYANYWLVKDQSQNWFNNDWYDNPYFIANEVVKKSDRDVLNGFINASYKLNTWLKISLRSGLDSHLDRLISQNPISARNAWSKFGYYRNEKYTGYSLNNDLILSFDKTAGDFRIEGLFGGTLFYNKEDYLNAFTQGGLSVPGFYSLKASVDPIGWETYLKGRQVNSLFSRMSLSWKSIAYFDITGRNDWSSTLSKDTRSYFYPSLAASFIVSEVLPKLAWLEMWKLRSSWTMSKTPAGIYDINDSYFIRNNVWGGYNSAYISTVLRGTDVRPQTAQTYEFGTAGMFFKNRLLVDLAFYRKRIYDFLTSAPVSDATGFDSKYVNMEEEHLKKGMEIMVGGTPVRTTYWTWKVNLNWSKDITYYDKLDKQYSPDNLWVKVGERVDAYTIRDWLRDSYGNIINTNGFPVKSNYYSIAGFANPDWIWGLNSSLNYKDITLSFSVDGRVGGVSFSRLDALLWNSGAHIGTDNKWRYDEVVNGLSNYIGPGVKLVSGSVSYDSYGRITSDTRVFTENDVPVSYESYMRSHYALGAWNYASQDVLKETFFKLREVAVSYKVPDSIGKKLKLKQLLISLVGQNLIYWGKEYKFTDPDYGQTWDLVSPSIRYLGINLKFNF